ncbi:MAG TPA: hypothetical protein VJ327_10795 [Patescibacteria group bacterium]|nr:hypothetical protein [Patescibacteria group bacterium]
MEKTVSIKMSEVEHAKFVAACKKFGVLRNNFAKKAILDKINESGGKEIE